VKAALNGAPAQRMNAQVRMVELPNKLSITAKWYE
jgi:hypothetical protein